MLPVILVASLFTLGSDYRAAYQQFQLSKNQFQQYKTESTRLTAVTDTRLVLTARNLLWKTYLQDLRGQLATDTNIADYPQTTVYLNLETELNYLNSLNFFDLTSLSQAKQLSLAWESRLYNSDRLTASARTQILSHRLNQLGLRLQPFIDQASPSSTLDLAKQKMAQFSSTTDLRKRYPLLLDAANVLLQLP
ncbi:MAG: hypothetical protein AAB887_00130 [Patescibacteria group bacterium]